MSNGVIDFFWTTGIGHVLAHPDTVLNLLMMGFGLILIALGIVRKFEPLLLIPIGFGMMMGNVPLSEASPAAEGVIHYLYFGVEHEIFPALIFLGVGAMTDFSAMLSQPRLILLGAAAQVGIFATYWGALTLGFTPAEAGAIGIIGGADGPTTIFITARLAPHLLPAVAVAAYGYMALVPVIQPPIVRLLTTRKERLIQMPTPREVSKTERILFPIAAFVLCTMFAPKATTLLGMLFFGNLLKESGVTDRLANTAKSAFIDSVTILLGICVGAGATAERFLTPTSLKIFALGIVAFSIATASGVVFAKLMNRVSSKPVNPILGAAGVSAVPMAARVAMITAQKDDPTNFLIMHAMAPNIAGVIGSAVAAGVLLGLLGG
ncbi:MAG: sodium ion-translocating decarboxylase subunit beta [Myxococcales bacterium]|jgi:oxaloacetate decarboxylase beta subunit|nr:sodium ion-translocating decarboxylase subunit beta [Myxococcales bacterium]